MMKMIGACVLVPALFTAGAAISAPLQCPLVSEVLAQVKVGAKKINVAHLGSKLSEVAAKNGDLHLIANRLKIEFPGAPNAEIADIMVAAYCQTLKSAPPANQDPSQLLTSFEKMANDAVFKAPNQEYDKGGWLFN